MSLNLSQEDIKALRATALKYLKYSALQVPPVSTDPADVFLYMPERLKTSGSMTLTVYKNRTKNETT